MLMLVITVIDITEKLDDFLKHDNLTAWIIFTEYYLAYIPYMANMLSPITIFIATIFVTANLAAKTEIVAILCSGVSYVRFLRPYFVGSILIAGLIFYLTAYLIPNGNKQRLNFERMYIKEEHYFVGRNVHIKTSPTTYVYLDSYNSQLDAGYQFSMETVENRNLTSKIKSSRIVWDSTKSKWRLEDYFIRKFVNGKEFIEYGATLDSTIAISPSEFKDNSLLYESFTLPELNEQIQLLKSRGSEQVAVYEAEKYQRLTYPFSIVILTLIGVIVSSKKSREGAGLTIAFGFLLAFVYIIFVITSRSTANVGGIGPLVAAWIPNILFIGIGMYMYKKVTK